MSSQDIHYRRRLFFVVVLLCSRDLSTALYGEHQHQHQQDAQLGTGKTTKMTIGQAVRDGLVDNETLGYFMTRTQLYLEMVLSKNEV